MRYGLVLLLVVSACGSESSGPTPQQFAEGATDCEQLVSTYCARVVDCSHSTNRVQDIETCKQQVHVRIDCGKVYGVTEAFPRCIQQLTDDTCAVLFPVVGGQLQAQMPAACMHVLVSTQNDGGA